MIVCASFFRVIAVTIGPETLGLVSAHPLYSVLNFVDQAGFFFLPTYLGSGSVQGRVTPILECSWAASW